MPFKRTLASSRQAPVFYDHTGRRWLKVLVAIIVGFLGMAGGLLWLLPQTVSPVWQSTVAQSLGAAAPAQPVSIPKLTSQHLPIVGAESAVLTRVDSVIHTPGENLLADPFSGKTIRALTEGEAEDIGNAPFVMERYGTPADHQLMITFDDGPDATYTPEILDVLSRNHVPATFFTVGEMTVSSPELFQRMVREGHMIGNHTTTHSSFGAHDALWNRAQLVVNDRIIRATAGYATRIWRLPYGDPDLNPSALLLGQELGYTQVDFDLDTEDWRSNGQPIALPELDGKGHVALMHDSGGDRSATVAMLQQLIDKARAEGYTFTTLAPLLSQEYTPVTGVAPDFVSKTTQILCWLLIIVPGQLLSGLFWFAVITMTLITTLFLVQSLLHQWIHNRRMRQWTAPGKPKVSLPRTVSVLIPAWNEGAVIFKTLEALARTNYPGDYEVIVIDDGSTDDTLEKARFMAVLWPRLRVLHQENAGKAAALNYGIRKARGEVIVTLDADTVFDADTISMLVRNFADPRVGVVAGQVKVGNRRGVLQAWQSLEYISGMVPRLGEASMRAISIAPGACSAWRKKAVLLAGGYSHNTLAEDADLTLQVQRMGWKAVQENQAIAWTEAPSTIRALGKQRLRWFYGNTQVYRKHWDMLLQPQYGALGMLVLPYAVITTLVPMLFMPLMVAAGIVSIVNGNWHSVVMFAGFVSAVHLLISVVSLCLVREKAWHLAIVPIYRPIYEVLRTYLLYATLFRMIKGRDFGWDKLQRTNSVNLAPTLPPPAQAMQPA